MAQSKHLYYEIKSLPVTVNHALGRTRTGRSYKTKAYKQWVKDFKTAYPKERKIKDSQWYGIEIQLYFPLFYKNGNVRKKDVSNYIKYAEDLVFGNLITYNGDSIDDCRITEGEYFKIDSEEEKTIINIYCIE